MKELVENLLNKNKKTNKVTGKVIKNPAHLKYVVKTRTGNQTVDATAPFAIGDNVVAYDGVIHSKAGRTSTTKIALV